MKNIKIVSDNNQINSFYCKLCKLSSSILYKAEQESYCELCVPERIKNKCKIVNQNREEISK